MVHAAGNRPSLGHLSFADVVCGFDSKVRKERRTNGARQRAPRYCRSDLHDMEIPLEDMGDVIV